MMISLLLSFWFLLPLETAEQIDPCDVFGNIYEVKDQADANLVVYIEDSEYSADLVVYEHTNSLFADRVGQWYFVENRSFSHFFVYITENRSMADFTIAFTETESFARCSQ